MKQVAVFNRPDRFVDFRAAWNEFEKAETELTAGALCVMTAQSTDIQAIIKKLQDGVYAIVLRDWRDQRGEIWTGTLSQCTERLGKELR